VSDYGHATHALARARAYDEGKEAARHDPNPYPAGSPEARSWLRGWANGIQERRTATVDKPDLSASGGAS
jgi:ribosome modulation factor